MATLPGLKKGITKDASAPVVDTTISPSSIPPGTTLLTTKLHNEIVDNEDKLIDYISGDASPDFIPQSAIDNLISDLSGKEPSLGFTPENIANKGTVSGYAGLDISQELLLTNFPSGSGLEVLRRNAGNTALEFGVGGNTLLRVIKKADEIVNNSTTFQDDDELFFSVEANKIYFILFNLQYSSPLSVNIKYLFTVPTGTTMLTNDYRWENPGFILDDATIEDLLITNPSIRGGIFWARIETSSTAGIIQLQWAQQIATVTDTKIHRGATIIVWEETP